MSSNNSGFESYLSQNKFNSAASREDCINLTKQFTGGNKPPHSSSNHAIPGITDTEDHKISEALEGAASMKEPASSPRKNAGDDQVNY
jgi:hypothetical protein